MTNPLILDAGANPPVGVANPSRIDFYLGNPPRRMLVFSGVAITNWRTEDEDSVAWEDVVVKLGVATTPYFAYTSTVGLASVSCDDTDFNFFANTSTVVADPQTGELELHVPIGVSGGPASLQRLAYHVQVLSDPVVGSIMGTIRWPDFFGEPSPQVLSGQPPMFTVVAGVMKPVPAPGGFIDYDWQQQAQGSTLAVPVNFNGTWAVPYRIDHVPLALVLEVRPNPPGGNFVSHQPPGFQSTTQFTPPVRTVELTPTAPAAVGVDFDMSLVGAVR